MFEDRPIQFQRALDFWRRREQAQLGQMVPQPPQPEKDSPTEEAQVNIGLPVYDGTDESQIQLAVKIRSFSQF